MRTHTVTALLLSSALAAKADMVLDEKIMAMTLNSAKLAYLTGSADKEPDGSQFGISLHDSQYYYDNSFSLDSSPDKAILAKIDGYCYASFSGTNPIELEDWFQNLDPFTDSICNNDDDCCDAREGFISAYNAPFREQLEADLRECAASCDDMDECIVLAGHSQGGATANIAAVIFSEYNPYVITFGQPGAVHEPCPYINSEKYFRFINSVLVDDKLEHDLIPFSPMMGSSFFGNMIIVSPQSDAVAGYGLDTKPKLSDFDINVLPFQAHKMMEEYGYIKRIEDLVSYNQYPILSNGWKVGQACSDDGECISGRCDGNICMNTLESQEVCDEDSDCASGRCYLSKCTRLDRLVDNGSDCLLDRDCYSGLCDGLITRQCKPSVEKWKNIFRI